MKTIPKNIRLVKLTRMLYQGQMFNTTEACSNIYGVDFTESQRRNIQNDFKFLIDETDLPIDVYLLEGNEKEISIINRRIQSGGGKISDLELFASFIQKQNNVIFKGTGFQQVLNKTTTLLIEQHAIRDVEVNFMYRDDLYDFFENIETGMFNYSHFSEDINKIIDIILKAQILQIDYHTKSTGEIGTRVCVPLKIIYNSGTLYLYVYDIDKKGERQFALHRIIPGSVISIDKKERGNEKYKDVHPFKIQDDFDIDEKRSLSFGLVWNQKNIQNVVLEFDKNLVDQIENRDWHFNPTLEYLENGNLLMKMKIDVNYELVNWIIVRLNQIKIHEPQELIDMIQERLKVFQAEHNLKNNN